MLVRRIALHVEMVRRNPSIAVRAQLSDGSRGTLPAGVLNRIRATTGAKVSHVHNLVFGTNGSYMMTWRGKDGSNYQGEFLVPLL
jgi:hypothetical protein